MRRSKKAQLLAHRRGRISHFLDSALQLVLADAEMPCPVLDFMPLAHRNMAAVAPALVEKIVAHLCAFKGNEKGPALGGRRGLFLPHRKVGGVAE
jgi:hypothetical protein